MSMSVTITPMTPDHWPAVSRIYAEGLATGIATFETAVPDWDIWDANHLPQCRLVAVEGDTVVGWTAISLVSRRYVYRGVVEHSIYIAEGARGKGIGRLLLNALIDESEKAGFWMLQTAIFRVNTASIGLHEKCGFRIVGYRERIGQRDGQWHDTVMMERRSSKVGV